MALPLLLAVVSVACFLGLAHAAVNTPPAPFRAMTSLMVLVAVAFAAVSPAAGLALLGPVLLARRLSNAVIPATVPELLDRYSSRRR